jgi:hypothetical protein
VGAVKVGAAFVVAEVEIVVGGGEAGAVDGYIVEALGPGVVDGEARGSGLASYGDLEGIVKRAAGVGGDRESAELRKVAEVEVAQAGGGIAGVVVGVDGVSGGADSALVDNGGAECRDGGGGGAEHADQRVRCGHGGTVVGAAVAEGGELIKVGEEAVEDFELIHIHVGQQLNAAVADVTGFEDRGG